PPAAGAPGRPLSREGGEVGWVPGLATPAVIHGSATVAPLKRPQWISVEDRLPKVIHGSATVAPLKRPRLPDRGQKGAGVIHGSATVAPLKQGGHFAPPAHAATRAS